MALFNGGRMAALFLFVKRHAMGARFIAVVLFLAMVSLPVMAAVEEATWGEIKANQGKQKLVRPAAKIADHEKGQKIDALTDSTFETRLLRRQWTSRRYNDEGQLEEIRYVFQEDGVVTLYQTIVESGEAIEPLVGDWRLIPDLGIHLVFDRDWKGRIEYTWVDVFLYINEEEDQYVLDFNDSGDKELRTLNQEADSFGDGHIRNWLVEPSESHISVDSGKWVVQDFKVSAADGHLPEHLVVEVSGNDQVHILSKPAYYGDQEVPHVNLCGPISGIRWDSTRSLKLTIPSSGESGFFVTRCGTARATINIYAPEAEPGEDEPLAIYRVR